MGRVHEPRLDDWVGEDDAVRRHQVAAFQSAFAFFNDRLFGGIIPPMTITFEGNPKLKGFYCPGCWYGWDEEEIGELSMNPETLELSDRDALSILVHKMCHYWQFGYGSASLTKYHNREWTEKMVEIGLRPMPAGEVCLTGQQIGHEVIAGGLFERAFAALPRSLQPSWPLKHETIPRERRPTAGAISRRANSPEVYPG